jgi:penicillin-binding protein 2
MQISGRDSNRYQTFTRRAALLAGAQGVAFIALAGRMYYLQVLKTDQYRMLAEENRVSMRLLAPLRGNIVDRFGRILAANRQNYRAMLISEQTPDVEATLTRLSNIVEIDDFTKKRILRDISRSPRFMPVTVAEGLTWDQFAQVNINEPDLAGIVPDVGETRDYPYGEELAHILGYVAAVSEKDLQQAEGNQQVLKLPGFRIGKEGIEKTYDRELRGVPGSSHVEVNAYGRVIRELAKDPGTPGSEVVLTLDMDVQRFAWDRLKGESASSVVLDIHTGDVISFVSAPAYDPNQFNMGYGTADYKAAADEQGTGGHVSAGFDIQDGGRHGRRRGGRRPEPSRRLSGPLLAWQPRLPLLEEGRAWRAQHARCDQAFLRCLLLRHGEAYRDRSRCRHGEALRPRRDLWIRGSGREAGSRANARVEAGREG